MCKTTYFLFTHTHTHTHTHITTIIIIIIIIIAKEKRKFIWIASYITRQCFITFVGQLLYSINT